jgi:hypothetical protein
MPNDENRGVGGNGAGEADEPRVRSPEISGRLKLLGTVLKEELKKIATADGKGKPNWQAEEAFDWEFSRWMFKPEVKLGDEFFKLETSHMIDAEGFLDVLRSQTGVFAGNIYNALDTSICHRLAGGETGESMLQDVIDNLNRIMADREVLGTEAEEKFDPIHRKIVREYKPAGMVRNRLRLQAAFPEQIANAWEALPVVYKWIHAHPGTARDALCLSGGGIRSATFGLGVIQGLAEKNVLERFQYLSTVSGGGYVGSWLTAWFYRAGFQDVCGILKAANSPAEKPKDPLNPEPSEIRYLREFSNYLTPKLGVLSVDTWTLLATYARNLFLNWCVFIPALALILFVPRICLGVVKRQVPDWLVLIVAGVGALCVLSALVFAAVNRPSMAAGHRRATSFGQREFLLGWFLPLCAGAECFTLVWAWMENGPTGLGKLIGLNPGTEPSCFIFLTFAVGLHLLAWIVYSLGLGWKGFREFFACAVSGAFGGLLLWTGARLAYDDLPSAPKAEWYVCFAAPWFLGSFLLALFLFVGWTSHSTNDEDRESWGRKAGWTLIAIGAWSLFSVLVMFGPVGLMSLPRIVTALGGVTGIATLMLAHSGRTPANRKEATKTPSKALPGDIGLAFLTPVFLVIFVSALSLLTTWTVKVFDPWQVMHNPAVFAPADILDLSALSARLKNDTNRISRHMWDDLMSPALREQITNYVSSGTRLQETTRSLVKEWNALLATNQLDRDAIPTNLLSKDTLLAINHHQTNAQLNRLLLQDDFKSELRQNHFDHLTITHQSGLRILGIIFGALFVLALVLSAVININRFSLHAVYRNRLIRAYLGASNRGRRPNPFTGFDPGDNLAMSDLGCRPLHVVNMALNLVAGEKLAWQQRKAESFTATPLHAGNFKLGYRDMARYATGRRGLRLWREDKGLRLGSAIAISGAAASPNMGYHSSPVLAFLMTLFNVRLGAWLGNPGKRGSECYRDQAPRLAFLHLVKEALGLTNDKDDYVYLSDGGHFENLGLYEMVLRRCRRIVVIDAGCDPKCGLEDLGNAIRKIRIDLGVPIEIDGAFQIRPRKRKALSKYCAVGRIHYGEVDGKGASEGELLYIKPAIGGDEPKDVYNYKEQSSLFPHEPTSDQWFSESQFESYRTLGKHILTRIWKGNDAMKNATSAREPAEELRKLENEDPVGYLIRAANSYLEKPFSDMANGEPGTQGALRPGRVGIAEVRHEGPAPERVDQ